MNTDWGSRRLSSTLMSIAICSNNNTDTHHSSFSFAFIVIVRNPTHALANYLDINLTGGRLRILLPQAPNYNINRNLR